ncbi:sorting nexin-18-like isoform X2 [Stegostoma tigrinum]|uniref:sorting nexin-18-like isoform X2 n=1 Tax=Stegostoma tigrinum TaxID=3053191 RepID=UPI00287069FE|nr:sorting nexin-18-like isoform X2 [Stegostoma tigrinum]
MALQARALYDFQSENVGEISVREDEVLTVYSEHDIDGWLEGVNSRGERGLFPASYVQIVRAAGGGAAPGEPPASRYANVPPGPGPGPGSTFCPPPLIQVPPAAGGGGGGGPGPGPGLVQLAGLQHQASGSGDDDDWDDDWDDNSTVADEPLSSSGGASGFSPELDGPGRYKVSTGARAGGAASSGSSKSTATVSRNLNRFSTFVKSGGEAFILGEAAGFVKDGDRICVVSGPHGPEWQEDPYPFSCSIDEPTKQTKFKGIKSYISYRLVPSHTQSPVNRRYKHFDWLYGRLVEKFPVISVPHIPEKQATGRFEEDFISKRKKGLILWMNHMTSHPVLARCDVFQHFLTCSDEKAWKQGKRKAEKDDMVGGNFFLTLSTPASPLDLQEVESRVDGFKSFTKRMDESVFQLSHTANEFARKQAVGFKKEYQKVGTSFRLLSQAFEMDQQTFSAGLNRAIAFTGDAYDAIGELFAEQPKQDIDPIVDLLALYQGHLTNFPDIIHVQKGALTKVKESKRHVEEGKMELQQADGVRERCDTISFATLAEIHHFHTIRVSDFKTQMQHFLQQQIHFYQKEQDMMLKSPVPMCHREKSQQSPLKTNIGHDG